MAEGKQTKYKPYLAYQASYAVWSGEVPDHWVPIRLKHVFSEKRKTLNPELQAGSISFGNVIFKNEDNLAKETKAAYQEVLSSEFLINPLNMNFDLISLRTALSSINVVVSTGYLVLQSNDGYNKNYLRWLLQQFDVAHMKTLGAGVRQTISFTDIGNSFIFEPPLLEQTKIAAFLDHETLKIDALIAKQQRLIGLLEEKRQAVISHAVTKGLNPKAPLRPSGIDWLGDVPAHWEIKKISWGFKATKGKNGQMLTKEYCGENVGPYPVYSGQTENEGVLGRISWYEFDFGEDGTLFATTVGAKAMNLSHLSGKLSLSQNCMALLHGSGFG